MLKKRRRKRKREKEKKSHKNYKENIGIKLIKNYQKAKVKKCRVWNFKSTMLKKRRRKKREKKQKQKQTKSQKL